MSTAQVSIKLQDALKEINRSNSGGAHHPFSIEFVTFNAEKKTGGELIALENAIRCGLPENSDKNHEIGITAVGNSHHPYQVHTNLITKFNDRIVI